LARSVIVNREKQCQERGKINIRLDMSFSS
jgi:hypothetical protein